MLREGWALFDGTVEGHFGVPEELDSVASLGAGHALDVAVGDGGDGHYFDLTALDVQIARVLPSADVGNRGESRWQPTMRR